MDASIYIFFVAMHVYFGDDLSEQHANTLQVLLDVSIRELKRE